MIFRRDVEYTQAELDKAAAELGSDGLYIGEWHSHLVPQPVPSATDIESLVGIARAPHYLTRCPVMLICGLDPQKKIVEQVCGWSIPIGGSVYPVPIADSAEDS
jgi:integrative and conjugative element protein (TIGR02256 family)